MGAENLPEFQLISILRRSMPLKKWLLWTEDSLALDSAEFPPPPNSALPKFPGIFQLFFEQRQLVVDT